MIIGTLPGFAVEPLLRHFRSIADQRAPDFTIGGTDNPYLRRWFVTPRGDDGAVYLHQFLRSDEDRALHDHPWPSLGIILDGQYLEHVAGAEPELRTPGMMIRREPETAHRVELLPDHRLTGEAPVWTLFLVGPRVRDWGFHCPQGWVPWQAFTAGTAGELVGKGCDQ